MRTKYEWEPSDIRGGVFFIRQSSSPESGDTSFALSVAYMIGYEQDRGYCFISLADGCAHGFNRTKSGFSSALNKDKYGYRPIRPATLNKLMQYKYESKHTQMLLEN